MPDVDLGLRVYDDYVSAVEMAQLGESLEYESVWTGELWGTDTFVLLTAIACHTTSVRMGSGIANVYSRSPAVLAMAGASLQRVSNGRAVLGVGIGARNAIQALHGVPFERPIRRTRETIAIIKEATKHDGEWAFDGEIFDLAGSPALDTDLPVYNAALGPANLRVTGMVADGWIPHLLPFPAYEDAFAIIEKGARENDRAPSDIAVTPYVPAAVSEEPDAAEDVVRSHIAYYVGSARGYKNAVETEFPDRAQRIHSLWQDGETAVAREQVDTEMLEALGVAGTPEEARGRVRGLIDSTAIDIPIVFVPHPADETITEDTIRALSPSEFT